MSQAVSPLAEPELSGSLEPEPISRPSYASRRRRDPLAPILQLGRRATRIGFAVGLACGFTLHGVATAAGLTRPLVVGGFAERVYRTLRDRMRVTYDVEMEKIQPPPPTPDEPPKPEPPEIPKERAEPAPKAEQPPTPPAAEAAKVLTADPDPDEPVDLTGNTFVTGNGEKYVGGVTTGDGTAKKAVYNPAARGSGVPPPPPPPPKVQAPAKDLSRAPAPLNSEWKCPFPAEADQEQIDYAVVVLVVTVGPDGRAMSVTVQKDPGYGFGARARQYALTQRYSVGLDVYGRPVTRTTPPINVRFIR